MLLEINMLYEVVLVDDLFKQIKSFTIGIRFKEMYKLLDLWGSIADDIVNDKEFFKDNYFTNISQNYTIERNVNNPETGSYLKITARDIIFCHKVTGNVEDEFTWFKKCILNFIIEKIIKVYNVNTFVRLGMVFNHELDDKEIYEKLISKSINKTIGAVNDIRFSVKSTLPEALVLKGKDDYINRIYTFAIEEGDKPIVQLDYQYYMRPMIRDIKDCKVNVFLDNSKSSLEKSLYNWICEENNGKGKGQKE